MRWPVPGSLRLRFLLAVSLWVLLGIAAIWFSAVGIFTAHVEQSYHEELEVHIRELGGLTEADGELTELFRVDIPRLAEQLPAPVLPVYVDLLGAGLRTFVLSSRSTLANLRLGVLHLQPVFEDLRRLCRCDTVQTALTFRRVEVGAA